MLDITLFTDPACPFAFSHEPVRQRLRWYYGDGLRWTPRMIVLTLEPGEDAKLAQGAPSLRKRYGMPCHPEPYARPASSEPACRAVVAARVQAPELAEPLLRRLRVRVMNGGLLDDPALITAAAEDVGFDLRGVDDPEVERSLQEDVALARVPHPAAAALDHKLGGPEHERRYTAPSYVLTNGEDHIAIPGFNPVEAYEAAIANLAPDLPRAPKPTGREAVEAWAPEPLFDAEIDLLLT